MNFDAAQVEAFLERLSDVVRGFGQQEIAEVKEMLDGMEVDEERELRYHDQIIGFGTEGR